MAERAERRGFDPSPVTSIEREALFNRSFAEFVRNPVDDKGRSLLRDFPVPKVLSVLPRLSNPRLRGLILESFDSLPIRIEVTSKNRDLFSRANLKENLKEGDVLVGKDFEGKLPPTILSGLKGMALRERSRRSPAFSQAEVLKAYLSWTNCWFRYINGEDSRQVIALNLNQSTVRCWLERGVKPNELMSLVRAERSRQEGGGEAGSIDRDLAIVVEAMLFSGKHALLESNLLERLGIKEETLGTSRLTLFGIGVLLEEVEDRFYYALGKEDRNAVVAKIIELHGSEKDGAIALFRQGERGLIQLRGIQEHLARSSVYTSITSQGKQDGTSRYALNICKSTREKFDCWKEGRSFSGLGSWAEIFFSRFYFYQRGLSRDQFTSDLNALRRRRDSGENVPTPDTLRKWYRGVCGISRELLPFFNVYGFDQVEEKREAVFRAARLYLRQGTKVVHVLKDRFPLKSLPELTRAFLAIDDLVYLMPQLIRIDDWPQVISPAMEQWAGLLALDNDNLKELLELKLVRKGFPEGHEDEISVQSLLEQIPVDLSDVPDTDAQTLYQREVGATPLLTSQQEKVLARLIEKGQIAATVLEKADGNLSDPVRQRLVFIVETGKTARAHFIEANLRLVESIARRYTSWGIPFLDLTQEGNLGLIKAVEKFDWRRGYKFSTYATWWIRQSITRNLKQWATEVRLPVHVGERLRKIGQIRRGLEQELGRTPNSEEIAERLAQEWKVSQKKALEWIIVLMQVMGVVSLEEPVGEYEEEALADFIGDVKAESPEQTVGQMGLGEVMEWALSTLSPREARILVLRFGIEDGIEHTLEEVGQRFGLTRERIRQIEGEALRKLRHPRRARRLKAYL